MKLAGPLSKLLGFALAVAAVLSVSSSEAAVAHNKAVVRAVRGTANYSTDKGATWKKLAVNTQIGENSTIRTATGSTVDLFLGDNGPVVRVTEDTTMAFDKLTSENTGVEKVIETQLDLRNGRILGNVKKLAAASKYEVKTPLGVAGIRGTQYDISADGTVTVVEGRVLVVYVIGGVALQPVIVNAGETVRPPANAQTAPVVMKATPDQLRNATIGPVPDDFGDRPIRIVVAPEPNATPNPNQPSTPQNIDDLEKALSPDGSR
jgi:hypothetical protein